MKDRADHELHKASDFNIIVHVSRAWLALYVYARIYLFGCAHYFIAEAECSEETSTQTIQLPCLRIIRNTHVEKPFIFDRVYFASGDSTAVCKASVKEMYEGSLPGYHMGTILLIFLLGNVD